MGIFWERVKSMRQNSRPLTEPKTIAVETAENKLFEPVPDEEIKELKKPKKRKETAVKESDDTTD